jgi:hypothetical protein
MSVPSMRGLVLLSVVVSACFDPGASTDDDAAASTSGVGASSGQVSESDASDGHGSDGPVSEGTSNGDASNGDASNGDTSNSDASSGQVSNSDGSDGDVSSGDVSSGGAIVCEPGEFGPACTPCTCAHGTCDDGAEGTGACACGPGYTGDACDVLDCGPEGTLEADGTCSTPLPATGDAQVVSHEYAADNFGDATHTPYAVGQQNDYTGNQIGRALLKFDLTALPPGAAIDAVTLRIKEYDNFAGFPMTLAVRPAESDWDEDTVTWDTQPDIVALVLDTSDVGCCGEEHELTVTSAVELALANDLPEITFALASNDETEVGGVRWFMREGHGVEINGIVGVAPHLVVRWSLP